MRRAARRGSNRTGWTVQSQSLGAQRGPKDSTDGSARRGSCEGSSIQRGRSLLLLLVDVTSSRQRRKLPINAKSFGKKTHIAILKRF